MSLVDADALMYVGASGPYCIVGGSGRLTLLWLLPRLQRSLNPACRFVYSETSVLTAQRMPCLHRSRDQGYCGRREARVRGLTGSPPTDLASETRWVEAEGAEDNLAFDVSPVVAWEITCGRGFHDAWK
ncbi:hypothetical protein AAHC03_019227 [Spirometra sp. Aus1]